MSATTTTTAAANLLNETAPRALVRIAIPSFKFWKGGAKASKHAKAPSREEIQNLFNDDLHRSLGSKVVLTDEERNYFEMSLELRDALYAKSH